MSGDRPSGVVDDTSAMTDWETSIARSGYRVRLTDGKWHDVPNFALIDPKTNKLGYAVVWVLPPTSLSIRCFLPGAGAENVGPFAECFSGPQSSGTIPRSRSQVAPCRSGPFCSMRGRVGM